MGRDKPVQHACEQPRQAVHSTMAGMLIVHHDDKTKHGHD